jgi:hypothetical protein
MRDETFKKLVKKILNKENIEKRYRDKLIVEAKKFIQKEDINSFLIFNKQTPLILDKENFKKFVCNYLGIKKIEDLEKRVNSKKESIEIHNDSKRKNIHTDENTIIIRKREKRAEIYYKELPKIDDRIVVVENYESFLNLDFNKFKENYFIYGAGFSKTILREFLEDKNVLFYLDFDFAGIKIFNSFKCKKKEFFIPQNLEEKLIKFGNTKLYQKQLLIKEELKNKKLNKEVNYLFNLINKHSKVLEQEIFNKG